MSDPSIPIRLDREELRAGLRGAVQDFRGAARQMGSSAQSVTSEMDSLRSGLATVGIGLIGVSSAIRGTIGFFRESIAIADAQVEAEKRLDTALRIRGALTDEVSASHRAFANEIQRTTKIGDEAVLGLETQLLVMGVHESQLQDSIRATIGMAQATGSLDAAAKLVARALRGDTGGLREYGISVDSVSDAMREMTSLFALAEEDARSFSGRMAQLGNAFGDLRETIGRSITDSDRSKSSIEDLTLAVQGLDIALQRGDFVDAFTRSVNDAVPAIGELSSAFDDLISDSLRSDIEALGSDLGGWFLATNPFTGPWKITLDAFDLAVGKLKEIKQEADAVGGFIGPLLADGTDGSKQQAFEDPKKKSKGSADRVFAGSDATGPADDYYAQQYSVIEERLRLEEESLVREQEIADRRAEIQGAMVDRIAGFERLELEAANAAREKRAAIEQAANDELERVASSRTAIVAQGVAGLTGALGQITSAAASGADDLGQVAGSAFGGLLSSVGQTLVGLGSAAVAAGTLGTVVPFLLPATGGSVGVGAGLAAIAVGTGLIAAGSGLSSAAGAGAPSTRTSAAYSGGGYSGTSSIGGPGGRPGAGFVDDGRGGGGATVINVSFSGRAFATEREVGRAVRSALDAHDGLRGGV